MGRQYDGARATKPDVLQSSLEHAHQRVLLGRRADDVLQRLRKGRLLRHLVCDGERNLRMPMRSSPVRWTTQPERGAKYMIATPSRQTAAPRMSHRSGSKPSKSLPHTSESTTKTPPYAA
jgi:hypothetical protein